MKNWKELSAEELESKIETSGIRNLSGSIWSIMNDEEENCETLHDATYKYFDRNPVEETVFNKYL